jgi:voltage-gated potassium channel
MDARSERIARRIEPLLIAATLLVVPVLLLQGSDLGEPWNKVAAVANWLIWLAFVAELVIMLAVVPNRRRWLSDHLLDVAIVIFTPPFASALVQSLRLLRLLGLLRLLRLAPAARATFSLAGVKYAALLAVLTTVVGGQAFADAEGTSSAEGLYWALTTVTTVGYGDPSPQTTMAKVVAVVVMLVGIGFLAILTGAIAQRFIAPREDAITRGDRELHDKLDAVAERLDRLEAAAQRKT